MMKRLAAAAVLLALAGLARAAEPAATPRPTPLVKAKAHGVTVNGRITRLDAGKKTMSVRDASGREVPLSWTAATKIAGGELKPGESVTLRYLDKDGRHIAAYIRVNAEAGASSTPTPSPAGALTAGATIAATPGR
jgi:hypothetical protein